MITWAGSGSGGAGQVTPELAAGLERLGYGTLWLGGSPDGDLAQAERLLDATTRLTLATSIVNMWKDDAPRSPRRSPGSRGATRAGSCSAWGRVTARPRSSTPGPTRRWPATSTRCSRDGVPADSLVLAALGPRVLRLAADRTAGAIPYLVTPEHTRQARAILGPGPVLAPEQKVVLEADPARARAIGRPRVRNPYLGLVNYTSNLRRLGWSDADLSDGGSDALIDALVAHGRGDEVAARLAEHFDAGADHVAVQLLTAPDADLLEGYRALAGALALP